MSSAASALGPAVVPRDWTRVRARSAVLPLFALVVGATWPTSVGGNIVVALAVAHTFLAGAVLLGIGVLRGHLGSGLQVWLSAAILAVVVGASALSPFPAWAPGAVVGYFALAALLALDLRGLTPDVPMRRALLVASWVLLAAGVAVVAAFAPVVDALVRWYAAGYPELVAFMTFARKPVFTFGSHSIAGFFYFLLFYLNLETARVTGQRRYLLTATALVALGYFLASVTAAVLMSCALATLVARSGQHRRLVVGILGVAALAGAVLLRDHVQDLAVVAQLSNSLGAQESGLSGRYASGGNLVSNLRYIAAHPFRPVGLTFSPDLFYGDSGPIEYLTRGSLPLLVAVYGALATFLFRSLYAPRHARVLLTLVVAFEAGFTILTYHRFFFLVVFAVLYLNHLRVPGSRDAADATWGIRPNPDAPVTP